MENNLFKKLNIQLFLIQDEQYDYYSDTPGELHFIEKFLITPEGRNFNDDMNNFTKQHMFESVFGYNNNQNKVFEDFNLLVPKFKKMLESYNNLTSSTPYIDLCNQVSKLTESINELDSKLEKNKEIQKHNVTEKKANLNLISALNILFQQDEKTTSINNLTKPELNKRINKLKKINKKIVEENKEIRAEKRQENSKLKEAKFQLKKLESKVDIKLNDSKKTETQQLLLSMLTQTSVNEDYQFSVSKYMNSIKAFINDMKSDSINRKQKYINLVINQYIFDEIDSSDLNRDKSIYSQLSKASLYYSNVLLSDLKSVGYDEINAHAGNSYYSDIEY